VGDFQEGGVFHNGLPEEEDVDVQGTLPPAALPSPVPPESGLYPVGFFQEPPWAPPVKAHDGGVVKIRLVFDVEGGSQVEAGGL